MGFAMGSDPSYQNTYNNLGPALPLKKLLSPRFKGKNEGLDFLVPPSK